MSGALGSSWRIPPMTTMSNPSLPSTLPSSSTLVNKGYYQDGLNEDTTPSQGRASQGAKLPYGPPKLIGLAALCPLVTVLVWSFGLGSGLLTWLLVKRISFVPAVSADVFRGYLVVDEGNKTGSQRLLDDQENLESSMRGLLIITAISHSSSMAVIPLMALGALHVAAQWLDHQAKSNESPTPLQFGLIMQMCSSGTWDSILMTFKYLFKHWRKDSAIRARVSPIVYHALIIASAVVILHYAVVATDLWLTAEVGSVYYSRAIEVDIPGSPIASALGTQHNTSVHSFEFLKDFKSLLDNEYLPPNNSFDAREDESYYLQGLDTMSGRSTRNHINILNVSNPSFPEEVLPMAIITRPPSALPSEWSWTAWTIGMTARCQPARCNPERGEGPYLVCPKPSDVFRPMPAPSFQYMKPIRGTQNNYLMGYDPMTGERLPNSYDTLNLEVSTQTNPSYLVMKLHLDSSYWDPRIDSPEFGRTTQDNNGVFQPSSFYLATCEITLYDVEVSFIGSPASGGNDSNWNAKSQYSLISPPIPISESITTQLLGPIMATFRDTNSPFNYAVMPLLARRTMNDRLSPGLSNRVSADFAELSLGLMSGMVMTRPANRATENSAKLVSRYPLWATLSYIGVVYAHGVLAFFLFVFMVRGSSKTVVIDEEKQKSVRELLLVQSRLTDPLAIVAEYLSDPVTGNKQGSLALSAQENAVKMFGTEDQNTMRVEVGLIHGGESGLRFGLQLMPGRRDIGGKHVNNEAPGE